MDQKYFDAIVIGGGINGSFAALHLAKKGKNTAIVEQFPLPHSRGSSGGQTRIIRLANTGPFPLTQITMDSYNQWEHLQEETNTNLIRKSPLMLISDESDRENFDKRKRAIVDSNQIPKLIDVNKFNNHFGTNFSENYRILEDSAGGILMADKCIRAAQSQFVSLGGTIVDEFQVTKICIQPDSSIMLEGPKGLLKSSSLIICAGSWTNRLLNPLGMNLPLKAIKVGVYYWNMKEPMSETFSFVHSIKDESHHFYGIPQIEYPNMIKICHHDGPEINPDQRESAQLSDVKKKISDFISLRFPRINPIPSIEESCIYTVSPDKEMIIDQLPGCPNIAFAAGFSGTGFKTAPTVGNILSELVLGMKPSFKIENFRNKRFEKKMIGNYDAIVIGGGINGSYAALQLIKKGKRTALLEQFPIPHSRGSSGGQTRIIRTANHGIYPLTYIMRDSYNQWEELQKETNTNLMRKKSMMVMAKKSNRVELDKMDKSIKDCNEIPTWWNVDQFNRRFGTNYGKEHLILEDKTAGILMANKCLQTVQDQFVALGGIILDEFPVLKIHTKSDASIIVEGSKGLLTSSALIVCAGAWTNRLLCPLGMDLPLRPIKVGVYYWNIEDKTKETITFYDSHFGQDDHVYGLPQIEYPDMVKICYAGREIDPDNRELADLTETRETLCEYISSRFPYLNPVPCIEESCIYTDSPDKEMILDQIPGHPNIAFGAGFSGSGFKTAPTVGNILSDLVLGIEPSFPIQNFRCTRFKKNNVSKL